MSKPDFFPNSKFEWGCLSKNLLKKKASENEIVRRSGNWKRTRKASENEIVCRSWNWKRTRKALENEIVLCSWNWKRTWKASENEIVLRSGNWKTTWKASESGIFCPSWNRKTTWKVSENASASVCWAEAGRRERVVFWATVEKKRKKFLYGPECRLSDFPKPERRPIRELGGPFRGCRNVCPSNRNSASRCDCRLCAVRE